MITTSRIIVVLRRELGKQLSIAMKQLDAIKIPGKHLSEVKLTADEVELFKDIDQIQKRIFRIERAIHALGALNLGDIEDKQFEGSF